ncbi:alkaline ceramidase family protein [Penicillium alfredii]|uniref:Alkaline ceramidase family protein n=1 Tax=Penicillium alfredii TaxID=1506179 RepID=A0A9W9K4G8_9EURO|nr:alkaline ceramidase family protein [Penicillium alfredii]KAJ5092281.1 alkaline ceramidase family protein [Penicillium alfredii]
MSADTDDIFWGLQTAKAKSDYVVTRYVAEFINSLTNLVYISYAIYGIRQLRQKSNVDNFRVLPYWGLMAVGICSAAFHMSLKYHTQMLDDLSMLFATTPVLHRVLTVNASHRKSMSMALLLGSALFGLVIYHVVTDELILHSVSFVGMVTVIGVRTMQLIRTQTPADSVSRKQVWGIVRFGALIFNVGYWCWLLDRWACGFLQSSRATIGLPLAFLLELHGWWHIFTGIGAYIFIAVVDHLVSAEDHGDIEASFAWPAPWASRSIFAGRKPAEDRAGRKQE